MYSWAREEVLEHQEDVLLTRASRTDLPSGPSSSAGVTAPSGSELVCSDWRRFVVQEALSLPTPLLSTSL